MIKDFSPFLLGPMKILQYLLLNDRLALQPTILLTSIICLYQLVPWCLKFVCIWLLLDIFLNSFDHFWYGLSDILLNFLAFFLVLNNTHKLILLFSNIILKLKEVLDLVCRTKLIQYQRLKIPDTLHLFLTLSKFTAQIWFQSILLFFRFFSFSGQL